jgi:hypothetical protein
VARSLSADTRFTVRLGGARVSSTLYAPEQQSAAADIRSAGALVAFARANQAYNDTDGTLSGAPITATSHAIRVKGDPQRLAALNLRLVSPITLLVAALELGSYEPTADDSMIFAGQTYAVKDVDPVAPDGTPILYRVTGSL